MHVRLSFCVLVFLAFAVAAIPAPAASAAKKSSPPKKKPAVKVDSTPVGPAKPGVVTTYADVVEPVQKAVQH